MNVRRPFVAGRFYPADKEQLIGKINWALDREGLSEKGKWAIEDKPIIGGVSPHAGYDFSLPHAAHLFTALSGSEQNWQNVLLLNPNHTGRGAALSLDSHDKWLTPLGNLDVDLSLRKDLLAHNRGRALFTCESMAQAQEHSAEVIVPLISYFLGDLRLLPLCMGRIDSQGAHLIAEILRDVISARADRTLILASSDFTHFRSVEEGWALDQYALDSLLAMDTASFYKRVVERDISICGYGPIMVLWEYAKLTARNPTAQILRRGHSGEADFYTTEPDEVVDYVSLLVCGEQR